MTRIDLQSGGVGEGGAISMVGSPSKGSSSRNESEFITVTSSNGGVSTFVLSRIGGGSWTFCLPTSAAGIVGSG